MLTVQLTSERRVRLCAAADENAPDMALREQIATRLREREGAEAMLDMRSSGALNKVTSETVKKCLPHGTRKPFPKVAPARHCSPRHRMPQDAFQTHNDHNQISQCDCGRSVTSVTSVT